MSQPREAYLQTQILTASPQRLRLMLIEGALRDLELTARLWDEGNGEQALEALIRCREIISELIAGIDVPERRSAPQSQGQSRLAEKVLGLYLFLFQALTEAQVSRDSAKLAIVRRILTAERDTWQQVCRQLAEVPAPLAAGAETASDAPLALEA